MIPSSGMPQTGFTTAPAGISPWLRYLERDNEQFAGECYDRDAAHPAALGADALAESTAESVASRHGNRRRIDDVALNAVGLEQAVNPETIEPDFLDRYNLDRRCDALLGSALQPRKKVEQFARITADERVLGHLSAAERQ